MKTILCEHVDVSLLAGASNSTRAVWLWLLLKRSEDGIVDASPNAVPHLAHVSKEEASEAFAWLKANSYRGDGPPIITMGREFRTSASCPTDASLGFKIEPWTCRCLQEFVREPISLSLRAEVLAIGVCAHCGTTEALEADHIRPVSLGGGSERENLQPLCKPCNRSKRNNFIG